MFIDTATVSVIAGKGGNGIVSFRRERYIARGGPDGGDGGNGGDVILVASNNNNTLANFRHARELKADDGANGGNQKKHGRSGKDLLVSVPVGTQVRLKGELIADLTTDGQQERIALGGKGGFGNAHFTSSTRQAPKVAEKGEDGEEFEAELELKIIADVGLVGLPNAGKSTLLSSVSSAKPKIANYPFTTLNPHLGVVNVDKGKELLMADIPGLIDGASDGKGLGDEFLRHVERTKVLLHMLDVYSNDIVADYDVIMNELRNYTVDLTEKPLLLALTKVEGLDTDIIEDQMQKLRAHGVEGDIYPISSLSKDGLNKLLFSLYDTIQQQDIEVEQEDDEIPVITALPDERAWTVDHIDGSLVVRGIKIERFARRTDFESEDGVRRLRDIMKKSGIMREIEKIDLDTDEEIRIYFGNNRQDYMEY